MLMDEIDMTSIIAEIEGYPTPRWASVECKVRIILGDVEFNLLRERFIVDYRYQPALAYFIREAMWRICSEKC